MVSTFYMTTAERQSDIRRYQRLFLLFLIGGFVGAIVLFLMWRAHPDLQYWKDQAEAGLDFLAEYTWALFLAIAILPGFGAPISPLLILAGSVFEMRYGIVIACLLGITGQAICSIWTYFAAVGPLRGIVENVFLKNRELPNIAARNALRIALIIRITPGIPFFVQNFSMGILKIPFLTYLLVSLPIQSLYGIGFIVTGGAIFKGNKGMAITGIMLIVVIVVATRMIAGRRKSSNA